MAAVGDLVLTTAAHVDHPLTDALPERLDPFS
jgi:hypothetical protein